MSIIAKWLLYRRLLPRDLVFSDLGLWAQWPANTNAMGEDNG
jgi:hypothetical protein